MSKTAINIPNFISGVSQQVPELRFPAQQEEQINGIPSIKNGFSTRYPKELITKLPSSVPAETKWHFIDRGSTINKSPWSSDWADDFGEEAQTVQYAVGFSNQAINAFNLNGRTESVNFVDGAQSYINTADPTNDLMFVSVQDYTFVLNKRTTTQLKSTVEASRPFECLIFVARATASTQYNVKINGTQQATFTTGASGSDTIDIATDLYNDLVASIGTTNYNILRSGSTIYIESLTGMDFDIQVESEGSDALKLFKGSTNKFSELPAFAVDGFRIKIENDTDYEQDNFWVEYQSDSINAEGKWVESRESGLQNEIDSTTMPHQLTHNNQDIWSDDWSDEFGIETFSLSPVNWQERFVGDEANAPNPSFVGYSINDIFFFRNRLGFASGENVIQSEDGNYTNFWPTTLKAVLDTDVIDVGTSHNKSSTFKHVIASQEKLLLFSDNTIFIFGSGDNPLSPKTVFINPSSEVSINELVKPFVAENSIFFVIDKMEGTSIKEISTDTVDDVVTPQDITTHVPAYVPKDVKLIGGSIIDNLLFFFAPSTPGTLYLYKFIKEGQKKILSAWFKWEFGGPEVEIKGFSAFKDVLYSVMDYTDGQYLYKTNLTPDYLNTGLSHPVLLDRLIPSIGVYDSSTNKTTWTLPYADDDTFTIVLGESFTDAGSSIQASKITRPTSSSIAASGDYSGGAVYIGKRYWYEIELTRPMLKQIVNEVPQVERSAVYSVHNFIVDYSKSSAFQVDVEYKDGTTRTYKFSGILSDNTDFQVGKFNFNSDKFPVPIKVKGGRKVTVKVRSDNYVPVNIYSGRWIMNVTRRKQRL